MISGPIEKSETQLRDRIRAEYLPSIFCRYVTVTEVLRMRDAGPLQSCIQHDSCKHVCEGDNTTVLDVDVLCRTFLGALGELRVAVRELRIDTGLSVQHRERIESAFNCTSLTISRLRHPNLARYHGSTIAIDDGEPRFSLIFEFLEQSLVACIPRTDETSNYNKLGLLRSVARGLAYLHNEKPIPVIHGDFNAACVVRELDSDCWKINNYAMTELRRAVVSTRRGRSLREKALHIAPEVQRGADPSVSADVFSFGVLALQVLLDDLDLEDVLVSKTCANCFEQIKKMYSLNFVSSLGRTLSKVPSERPAIDDLLVELESELFSHAEQESPVETPSSDHSDCCKGLMLEHCVFLR